MRFLDKTHNATEADKKSDIESMAYPAPGDAPDIPDEDDDKPKTTTKGGDRSGDPVDMWSVLYDMRQEVLAGTFD
jgi:hypothetical protein